MHRSNAVRNASTECCGAQTQRGEKKERVLYYHGETINSAVCALNGTAELRHEILPKKSVQRLTADRGVLSFFDTANSNKCALSTFPSYSLTFMRAASHLARLVLSVAFVTVFYCITSFLLPSSASTRRARLRQPPTSPLTPTSTKSNGIKRIQRLFV